MRWWQRNRVFEARSEGLSLFNCRDKSFDYIRTPAWIHLRYVSMSVCVVFGSSSRQDPPPSGAPPYNDSMLL